VHDLKLFYGLLIIVDLTVCKCVVRNLQNHKLCPKFRQEHSESADYCQGESDPESGSDDFRDVIGTSLSKNMSMVKFS